MYNHKKRPLVVDFYDQNGKRRLKTLPKETTKTDARKILADIEREIEKGVFLPKQHTHTFDEVTKDWIKHKTMNLRASTWAVYEGHTRNHFQDFGQIKITCISTKQIEAWIAARQKEGMNIFTIRKLLVTLGQIMAYAVRHKYIDYNPVREAERPRGQGNEKKSSIKILIPSEINQLLNAETNQKYRMLFMLTAMSGARQGELLGLKWDDIIWQTRQMHIQRTFNNEKWFDTKTASNRKVDIGQTTTSELKKWKLACSPNDLDLFFPNESGSR